MSRIQEVRVPDVGGVDDIDVVELLVAAGDTVSAEDGLVVLATDKASMDLPSPSAGTVKELKVAVGDTVAEGDLIALLEVKEEAGDGDEAAREATDGDKGGRDGGDERKSKGEQREGGGTAGDSAGGKRRASTGGGGESSGAAASEGTGGQRRESVGSSGKSGEAGRGSSPRRRGDKRRPTAAEREKGQSPSPAAEAPEAVRASADLHAPLVVIGSGPGGYSAAFRAADLGLDVTLVERYRTLGGVCLNVGCIPSKALLHAAEVIDQAAAFADHGLTFGDPKIDLDRLRSWKQSVVRKLTDGLSGLAKRRKVRVIEGEARFASDHALEIATTDGPQRLSFDQAIVAVGSRPTRLPFLPDDPRVMDSTAALELQEIPGRLLVVGGGIIGLEMATVYAALGAEITVVELLDGLMPEADRDLVKPLEKRLKKLCKAIYTGAKITQLDAGKKALTAHFEGESAPKTADFDRVLVAVGRRPNGDRIDAETAGLTLDGGFLPVDVHMRTNLPHIFAIGDVARPPMLAHKSVHEGKVAAEVAAGEKSAFDARVIPSVAYTDPEVAWVGLTEKEAKDKGIPYEKASFPWAASGRNLALGREDGTTKLLFDPETDRLLGAAAAGSHAGDLISETALAIEMGCEARDIALTIHPHPTLSETIAFAAEAHEGTLTDLYIPKRRKKKG